MRSKVRWLDRRIGAPGPFLTLCLSAEEFAAAMLAVKAHDQLCEWVSGGDAKAHIVNVEAGLAAVVCVKGWEGRNPIEVAGLLVHEAVHVWQFWADSIGEKAPGAEQEAYAVQAIAQELMAEFARRTSGGR